MCKPGEPCNGTEDAGKMMIQSMKYLHENREAIKAAFERAYAEHPGIKNPKVQEAIKDKPRGADRLKDLCEQFYLAGIFDLLRNGTVAFPEDGEDEPEGDTFGMAGLEKLGQLVDALKEAQQHFGGLGKRTETVIKGFNNPDELDIEVPDGHDLESAHVYDGRTGKSHKLDVKGKSKAEVQAMIRAVLKEHG